jgi:hypothetical protein
VKRRSSLRKAAEAACLPQGALFVLTQGLLLQADENGIIHEDSQPTFRQLQQKLGKMSSRTLADSLEHLERHHWLTRGKAGKRVRYELSMGELCECRPGRGHPMTDAERQRKSRKQRAERRSVTLTGSKNVTLNRSNQRPDVTSTECDKPHLRPGAPVRGSDTSLEPTEVRASALAKDAPPFPGFDVGVDLEKHGGSGASAKRTPDLGGGAGAAMSPRPTSASRTPPRTAAVTARGPVADRNAREGKRPQRGGWHTSAAKQAEIARLTDRPGWTALRIAREVGCSEMTAFKYMKLHRRAQAQQERQEEAQ